MDSDAPGHTAVGSAEGENRLPADVLRGRGEAPPGSPASTDGRTATPEAAAVSVGEENGTI